MAAACNPADRKTQISKNLAQMSFMQRAKKKVEKQEQEATEKREIDDEHWVRNIPELSRKESKFITEPSYAVCARLLYGRGSFGGFNPEIEKIYKQKILEIEEGIDGNREEDDEEDKCIETIGDVEMTERYSSLCGTIAKKMTKKRSRSKVTEEIERFSEENSTSKKKKTFRKPADD